MKRSMTLCKQGHLHPNASSAATCDVAWRHTMRKKLNVQPLIEELRKVIKRRTK